MKNLKFRVWDKKSNIYLKDIILDFYPVICYKHDDYLKLITDDENYVKICKKEHHNPEDWAVQQFIGLKDKNGKEIYEGDIVDFTVLGWPHECEPDYVKNAEVLFSEEDAMFVFGRFKTNDNLDYFYSFADRIDKNSLEIVGNIFENLELLKK